MAAIPVIQFFTEMRERRWAVRHVRELSELASGAADLYGFGRNDGYRGKPRCTLFSESPSYNAGYDFGALLRNFSQKLQGISGEN